MIQTLIGCFVISFLASLCADFVAIAFFAFVADEIKQFER